MSDQTPPAILGLTAQIVSAHISRNPTDAQALPSLIQSVFQSLSTVGETDTAPAAAQAPAVPIKSVFADHIVCLEDGKKLKMLKRHLQTSYNLTPEQYRAKWNLPRGYPMVAPNYAAHRSSLAKKIGLGLKPRGEGPQHETEPAPEPAVTHVRARRAKGSRA